MLFLSCLIATKASYNALSQYYYVSIPTEICVEKGSNGCDNALTKIACRALALAGNDLPLICMLMLETKVIHVF